MASYKASKRTVSLLSLLLTLLIIIGQYYGWFDSTNQISVQTEPGEYRVTRYADGDTISVDINGTTETVRFIGVDTPETHDPRKGIQCGGKEASNFTENTIRPHGKVRLEKDVQTDNRDRYNRLLRYVYLPDGKLMNQLIITEGYGFAYTNFPFTKSALFTKDEALARQAKRGIWTLCTPVPNEFGGYTSNTL